MAVFRRKAGLNKRFLREYHKWDALFAMMAIDKNNQLERSFYGK